MSIAGSHESGREDARSSDQAVQSICDALVGLQFGQVTVTIQNGRIMQIERTERHRLLSEDKKPSK